MTSEQDYYGILGVPRDASTPEIRRAYRRLALKHHPDRDPQEGSSARFRELNSAYGVLSDPAERAGYDRVANLGSRTANLEAQATDLGARPTDPRERVTSRGDRTSSPVHGVLELSAQEAKLAVAGRLVLSDQRGLTITLPSGARDGDTVVFKLGEQTAVLTIRVASF